MKNRTLIITLIAILSVVGIIFICCVDTKPVSERELLRLHIRADSNDAVDQNVKLKVRDDVVKFLSVKTKDVKTVNEAYNLLSSLLSELKRIADNRLKAEGMSYTSSVRLSNEYFPTRAYGDLVLGSGYYDALIIELGSGKGDNWWCVVFPPLCYLEATDDFAYKSKIKELIEKYL